MAGSKSRTSASTDAATDGVARVEIVTRGEARREYTAEERAQVLTEAAMPGELHPVSLDTHLSEGRPER